VPNWALIAHCGSLYAVARVLMMPAFFATGELGVGFELLLVFVGRIPNITNRSSAQY